MKHPARLALLALCASLAACSVLEGDKIEYKSAAKAPTLEVPPDLTQLARDARFVAPGGTASASAQVQAPARSSTAGVAPARLGDVRIERAGNQRWLVVDRPVEQLWNPVRDFWQDNGFLLTTDEAALGIMETDWAENRAKIPQDMIRNTLGKVFDSLYSTGERDRFRTRMERRADGGTEIFISHRGVAEVVNSAQRETTVWQPRPANPELEAEFLRRLMAQLGGVASEQARAAVAAAPAQPTARVARVGQAPVVQLDDGFDRAWRRVGLSLDRTGFTVEDRDRAKGTYFVRYVAPKVEGKEPGFFARLLSRQEQAPAPLKYRILVRSEGQSSTVSVLDGDGAPETSANAQRIVQVLADDLK